MKLASPHHDRDSLVPGAEPRRQVFHLADLPRCVGASCEQGDAPCTDGCPNVAQGVHRTARPDNTGTVDPVLLHQAAGMSTVDTTSGTHGYTAAPDDYPLDYMSGWRAGSWYGLLAGLMLGALVVGLAVQLGWWAGGR